MFYLSRLFSRQSLKFLLLLACMLVVAAGIWYLGPFSGFGTTRPLTSVSARILCIAAVWLWMARFYWRVPLFIPLALTASVIVWIMGPWLLAGKSYPLAPASVRLAIVLIIWLVALVYTLWLFVLAVVANPTLLNRFRLRTHRDNTRLEYAAIARKIRHAAVMTNKVRTQWRRWWATLLPGMLPETVPWYVVLGSEGVGKTSLIATSGQDFPLPEQLSRTGRENAPTQDCECWFGNDALFVDTAGKYLNDDETVHLEWASLLSALRKYRARDGINGAIVAVSAEEIMQGDGKHVLALATRIRARLDELRQTLGSHFPVYVVITRLDRLRGFEPWFRSMTNEAREQVWGVTFPWGEMVHTDTSALHQRIVSELDALQQRLASSIHPRQQEEYVLADRKLMYAFPLDFQLLCSGASEFLQQAFFSSRYDETQFCASFRGVYFSSACQTADAQLVNHSTAVSRWRNYFAPRAAGAPACSAERIELAETPHPRLVWGKHYFLRRLFADVIVRDAGLVTRNFREEARFRLRRLLGHCALIVLAVVLIQGFVSSYAHNSRYLDVVRGSTRYLDSQVSALKALQADAVLPKLLMMARQLPEFGDLDLQQPPLDYRYGLYVGHTVNAHSGRVYRYLLRTFLLPSLQTQATEALSSALSSQDQDRVFESLKVYLGVYGQGYAGTEGLLQAISQQWEEADKLEAWGSSANFISHLQGVFAHPEWLTEGAKVNEVLIRQARTLLGQRSLNARLYQRIKADPLFQSLDALTLNQMTGDASEQILMVSDDELAREGIPGFFTKAGYQMLVKKKFLYRITQLQREDEWVMGTRTEASVNVMSTREGVLALYLREYAAWWTRFLDSIQLIALNGDPVESASPLSSEIYVLRILASSGSPLDSLAREVVAQTTLAAEDKSLPDILQPAMTNSNRLINNAKKLNDAADYAVEKLTRREVDDHFRALREFVNGQGGRPSEAGTSGAPTGSQLNQMNAMLSELYTLFVVTNNSISNGDTPVMPDTETRMSILAQTWPNPFQSIIRPFLTSASEKVEYQALASNSKNIDDNLGLVCRDTLENRYPFARSTAEVNMEDFERFFARDGLVDSWFKQNLASKVDTSQAVWHYKGTAEEGNLAFFRQVAQIRNAFFRQGSGNQLAISPGLSVTNMDPAIVQLNMTIAGSSFRYLHGPVIPWQFHWPASEGTSNVNIDVKPAAKNGQSSLSFVGPWAIFHWMDTATQQHITDDGNLLLTFETDNRRVDLSLSGMVVENQSFSDLLRNFRCPEIQ